MAGSSASERQWLMGNKYKQPVIPKTPTHKKVPVLRGPLDDGDATPILDFAWFDSHEWWDRTRGEVDGPCHNALCAMRDYCKRTWKDIQTESRKRDHPIDPADICKEAQDRLVALKINDIDVLWRFRFSGPQRLWGYKQGRVLLVIWWDPHHKVYPSKGADN